LGIRIPDPDPGARKLRNFIGKMHFLVTFNKNFTNKKVKNSTNYFLKKNFDEFLIKDEG
jgi:hypothetical protein